MYPSDRLQRRFAKRERGKSARGGRVREETGEWEVERKRPSNGREREREEENESRSAKYGLVTAIVGVGSSNRL